MFNDSNKLLNYEHTMIELKDLNKSLSKNEKLSVKLKKLLKWIFDREVNFSDTQVNPNYYSDKKIAVYTVVFGEYDKIYYPIVVPDNCDFYVITDQHIFKDAIFSKINVDLKELGLNNKGNVEKNRYFKMLPHTIFKDYDYSIYIDGNIKVFSDLTEFINVNLKYGIAMHKHPKRNCVYEEIKCCKKLKKDDSKSLNKHSKYLIKNSMPKNYGMLEASVIVREHNNPQCIKIMEQWWKEYNINSKRDQISLPYVLWKNSIDVNDIGVLGNNIRKNYAFRQFEHEKTRAVKR